MSFKYDPDTDSFIHVKDEEPNTAQPEQSIAKERYEDLCEYFKDCSDQGRNILTDRKEFKSWLDRMKWHVMECDKLGRELEKLKSAQPEQPTRVQDILQYLDEYLHPIVSPEHWNVYSELHDMISALPSVQPEKRTQERTETHSCDLISRQKVRYKLTALVNELEEIFANIRERNDDDSVCGLCEYDGAYIGQSGDWCNECPGFDKSDCFKLKDKYREEWVTIDE